MNYPHTPPTTADLYDAHSLKNYNRSPLTLVRGEGIHVWDDEGIATLISSPALQ